MKAIVLIVLLVLNVVCIFNAYSPYLVTFAELPLYDVPLGDRSPETVAKLLGHERHVGMEAMRHFLSPSVRWFLAAVLLNLAVSVSAVVRGRVASDITDTSKQRSVSDEPTGNA